VERAERYGDLSFQLGARRFQEWEQAGVFCEIWRQGLLEYDHTIGIDWSWWRPAELGSTRAKSAKTPVRLAPWRDKRRGGAYLATAAGGFEVWWVLHPREDG
jgi:hypothetical protein